MAVSFTATLSLQERMVRPKPPRQRILLLEHPAYNKGWIQPELPSQFLYSALSLQQRMRPELPKQ